MQTTSVAVERDGDWQLASHKPVQMRSVGDGEALMVLLVLLALFKKRRVHKWAIKA